MPKAGETGSPCSRWHAALRVWFIAWISAVAVSTYFWLRPLGGGGGVPIPIDIANGASIAVLFVTGIVYLFLKERAMGIAAIGVSLFAVLITVDAALHYHTFPR